LIETRQLDKEIISLNIKKNDKVLEIGSNNCSFLDLIQFKYTCKTLGVDPAKNLKSIYKSKNINEHFALTRVPHRA
jgi:hypothetical protein